MDHTSKEWSINVLKPGTAIDDETFGPLLAAWNASAEGKLPLPDLFDMVEYAEEARWWAWLDVAEGNDLRVRFVGTAFDQYLGMEVTGQLVSELEGKIGAEPFIRLTSIVREVLARKAPVYVAPHKASIEGREWATISSLTLPFSNDGKTISRILLCARANY